MESLNINRKFERMFPGIGAENSMFEKDLLAGGSNYAETQKTLRIQQQTQQEVTGTLLGHMKFNFETGEEEFIPAPGYEHLATKK